MTANVLLDQPCRIRRYLNPAMHKNVCCLKKRLILAYVNRLNDSLASLQDSSDLFNFFGISADPCHLVTLAAKFQQ